MPGPGSRPAAPLVCLGEVDSPGAGSPETLSWLEGLSSAEKCSFDFASSFLCEPSCPLVHHRNLTDEGLEIISDFKSCVPAVSDEVEGHNLRTGGTQGKPVAIKKEGDRGLWRRAKSFSAPCRLSFHAEGL